MRPTPPRAEPPPGDHRIARIGDRGDGLTADGRVFPCTLPDELLSDGQLIAASPDRVAAPCRHFGRCGGCRLQHWAPAPYHAWKSARVGAALRRAGFALPDPVLHVSLPGSRRRMDLAIRRARDGSIALGLHEAGSSAVVDFAECPVLHPALFALLAPLRRLLRRLTGLRREGSLLANLLDSGPDLLLRLDAPLTVPDRTALAAFAAAHALPRIATALDDGPPEIAAQHAPVAHRFAGVAVTPPPGAFLQATREGEAAIVAAVLAGLPTVTGRAWIADLFAGIGTLSLPLAARAPVRAAEGDTAAAAALRQASANRVAVQHRDLGRRPLLGAEWSRCACVVLDPPHAGAAAQVAEIVRAKVPRVIYVSCNPATLARDAAVLHSAGYRLLAVTAVDQFLWSAQVESVSVFAA